MGGSVSTQTRPAIRPLSSLVPRTPEFQQFCQDLLDEGFAVIGLGEKYKQEIDALNEVSKDFFKLPPEIKLLNDDPKHEGLGYVGSNSHKEYLKLRRYGDRNKNWPNNPPQLRDIFIKGLDLFHEISWKIYQELSYFTLTNTNPKSKPYSEEDWKGIKEAVFELGSIGATHYYPRNKKEADSSNLVDICDAHRDTGILTFVVVSEVPGLQLWDRKNNVWMDAEKILHPERNSQHILIVMMGEKVQMFTGSSVLEATYHRVMVPPETRRDSLLFFMDVSP